MEHKVLPYFLAGISIATFSKVTSIAEKRCTTIGVIFWSTPVSGYGVIFSIFIRKLLYANPDKARREA